jgi:hypothetical protein
MAERNHLRIADHNDLPNDDPFAELTRIMGFDPRQPVRPQSAAEPAQGPAGATAGEDDFGIDLEKELMGELEAEEAAPDAQAAFQPYQDAADQPYQDTAEPTALDAAASAELDEASFEMAAFEDELTASLQDEPALPETDEAEEQIAAAFEEEFSLDDDFMASDTDDQAAADTPPVEAYDDAVADEPFVADSDVAPTTDLAEAAAETETFQPAAEAEAFEPAEAEQFESAEAEQFEAAAEEPDFAFDEALEEELARDVASPLDARPEIQDEPAEGQESLGEEGWELEADEDAPDAAGEPLAVQPSAAEASDEPFADEFDTALAEVDMDFSAMRAAVDEHAPAADDGDLNRELQFRLDHDGVAEALAEPDLDEPVEGQDELSLEDELNALLGNMPERGAAIAEAPVVEAVAELPAVEATSEAPAAEPAQAAADGVEENLLDDLADDLDAVNWAFDAAQPAETQAFSTPEDDLPLDDAVSADLADFGSDEQDEQPAYAEAGDTAEYVAAAAPEAADMDIDLDLEFDDEAFDAAISSGIAEDEPVLHGSDDNAAPALQEVEQPVSKEDEDPYAALAALTASMRRAEPTTSWRREEPQPVVEAPAEYEAAQDHDGEAGYAPSAYEDFPDIETIEVPEQAVALADDLDIPEIAAEENVPPPAVYDDLDAEFADLLSDLNAPEKAAPAPAPAHHADDYAAEFERAFARQEQPNPVSSHAGPAAFAAGLAGGAAFAGASHAAYGSAADVGQREADFVPGGEPVAQDQFAVDDYDPDLDEDMSVAEYSAATREQSQRRGMLVAAIVGGVAVLGGLGAFAMSFGEGGSGAPAVVKADAEPVKVRPENPGGTTVPNQDKAVYDRVAGSGDAAQPKQEKLLSSAEEPIDVPAPEPRVVEAAPAAAADAETQTEAADVEALAARSDAIVDTLAGVDLPQPAPADALPQAASSDLPGVTPPAKSEDRIAQVLQESGIDDDGVEVAAVAPRKVRTMIVKADGTLVPRQDPEPVAEAPAAAPVPAANANAAEPAPDATGTVPPAENAAVAAPTTDATQAAEPAETAASATPDSVPLAPARPSDQPVDIVGEVKTEKVAALSAPSAANGAWSMQIASQPSEAAAQSSYQDLLRRYGSILEGHQTNIVKAEIAGKGTFWRVRVPAGSRSDAIKLCESYKSAGGNCFVSK